jgi:simple sugar transport system substrate-binding protein
MKKILVTLLVALIATLGLSQYHFYVVTHGGPADPFWAVVVKGMKDAAQKYGVKATYLAPVKYSLQQFINDVNSAIAAKPDGIVVTITNAQALDEPLRRAIAEGIPVIAINVPDTRPASERIPYLCYVGDNEYLAGVKAAEYVLSQFTPKRAVIAIHEITNTGLLIRAKGITSVFEKHHIPIDKLNITTNPTQGVSNLRAYLMRHPDTDMIFTLGPVGTLPAVTVVDEMGLEGKVKIGGFDLTQNMLKWIEEGKVLYTVDQQQYLQGYLPIEFLYMYLKHALMPVGEVLTGPFIVTKKNVKKVEESVKTGYR